MATSKGFFQYGALGMSFTACRFLQFACLISVLGMTSRFISELVDDIQQPPEPLIGMLCVTVFATLYTITTYILYYDGYLPFIPTAACDFIFFLALLTASVIVGKPLSYLSCKAAAAPILSGSSVGGPNPVRAFTHTSSSPPAPTTTVYQVHSRRTVVMAQVEYGIWVGGTEHTCVMMKAVWGLGISLTILFVFSAFAVGFLWKRRGGKGMKQLDG